MKTTKILALAFVSVIAPTACTKDNETTLPGDGAVRFTAGIGAVATPESRAAGTSWDENDETGIFMVGNGTIAVAENTANRKHTTPDGDGAFEPATGEDIYYPVDGSAAVDFIAYYPYADTYSALTTPYAVEIATTQDDTNQPGFDLLWAKANNLGAGYTKASSGAVPLVFDHKLAKIVMTIVQPGENANSTGLVDSNLPGMGVTIKGMLTKAEFNLAAGTLGTVNPGSGAAITPRPITDGKNYDAIILPGAYADGAVTVEFKIGSDTYIWNVGAKSFAPGTEYAFDVTISKTGVTATGTISSWTPAEATPTPVVAE